MDRRRAFAARALGLIAAFGVSVGAAAAPPKPAVRELRWIDPALPRAELVRLLTTAPRECRIASANPDTAAVAIGRAAFNAPLLLGGQAARAGVACASCHRAGRGNPHFAFPGVSGRPGTADVTSSLFSSRRGDGIANPRPIPDLAADPARIDRDPASPALRAFIRGLVVEEFDGLEPSPAVLDGLAAYVRALGGNCGGDVPLTADAEAEAARAAIAAATRSLAGADAPTAYLMIGAARSALGRLDERYSPVAGISGRLAARDAELRQVQAMTTARPAAAAAALDRWTLRFGRDVRALRATERRSLYDAGVLETALAAARPQ